MLHKEVKKLISNLLLPFYFIKRDMEIKVSDTSEPHLENDAEHSWSLATLCCAMVEHIDSKLDIGLVAQIALVHDLVEIYAKDTSVWAEKVELDSKAVREGQAFARIKEEFSQFQWMIHTIEKYENLSCNEALYVKAMDKYMGLCVRFLDKGKFFNRNKITRGDFELRLEDNRKKAHLHPGVALYYEEIRKDFEANPQFFYNHSSVI